MDEHRSARLLGRRPESVAEVAEVQRRPGRPGSRRRRRRPSRSARRADRVLRLDGAEHEPRSPASAASASFWRSTSTPQRLTHGQRTTTSMPARSCSWRIRSTSWNSRTAERISCPRYENDLAAVPPLDVRSEAGYDDVRVAVDDHATGSRPRTGVLSTARGSWPRSSSITIAAFRPGAARDRAAGVRGGARLVKAGDRHAVLRPAGDR